MAQQNTNNRAKSWRRRITKPSVHCPKEQTYKTSLCDNFSLYGSCPYGSKCQYAHGVVERRERPNTKNRVVMCKNFLKTGRCPYGSKCAFVHTEASKFNATRTKRVKANRKYKTSDCKFWAKDGRCPYGDQCGFRHVNGPLRPTPVPIKNKEDQQLLLVRNDNFESYMKEVETLSPISVTSVATDPHWLVLPR